MTYVESRGESICQSCLEEDYRYAYGRRSKDYYHVDDCVYCESDGGYYLEDYANCHDIYECPIRGRWYHVDDMVAITVGEYVGEYVHHKEARELPDGEWCTRDEYDDLLEEHTPQDDDEEEAEVVTPPQLTPTIIHPDAPQAIAA